MPFVLILLGAALISVGARGKTADLLAVLNDDFVPGPGKTTFIPWVAAFVLIAFIGQAGGEIGKLTDLFATLVIIVILLSNKGFIAQFQQQALNP